MVWRVCFEVMGGHVHCRLYCSTQKIRTFAYCGEFRIRAEEFEDLKQAFSGAEFIGDSQAGTGKKE